jgi:hypothetical protein
MEHEGRRDPFQCLYTHLEQAPAVIMYDFACQLSEYCRNREPAFFANTRFFIDKFHYWNHKPGACSRSFQVTRLEGYRSLNDSICEQWHSSVDSLSQHMGSMNQLHFMLTLQSHLKHWAARKLTAWYRGGRLVSGGGAYVEPRSEEEEPEPEASEDCNSDDSEFVCLMHGQPVRSDVDCAPLAQHGSHVLLPPPASGPALAVPGQVSSPSAPVPQLAQGHALALASAPPTSTETAVKVGVMCC